MVITAQNTVNITGEIAVEAAGNIETVDTVSTTGSLRLDSSADEISVDHSISLPVLILDAATTAGIADITSTGSVQISGATVSISDGGGGGGICFRVSWSISTPERVVLRLLLIV